MAAETEHERTSRRHRRTLFDGAADHYDAYRPGYPREIVDVVAATAGLDTDSSVLEVGCGTGQLTERLADLGFHLTAIDIGPHMVAAARRRPATTPVLFHAIPFEDFQAVDHTFDLIVSGTAFHWIDPEIKFRKPADLLREGGWLALLSTGETYDDPLGRALLDMWTARTDHWWSVPGDTAAIAASGLFDTPVHRTHTRRIVLSPDAVIGVENTRATSLSWPPAARHEFTEELRAHLRSHTEVHLTQQTSLTMARVLPPEAGGQR
jgi:SAM-dependent methyltransferase